MARGNKTISFYFQKKFNNSNRFKNFGFNFLKNKGKFWTDKNSDQEFNRLINYVKKIEIDQWKKENFSIINKIMQYDQNNLKFKNLLN